WENARLLTIVRTQVELARALRRQQRLEAENRSLKPDVRPLLIAEAPSMRPVLELIARVGPSEANVLVTGENGTGKGTVAQALHAVSGRAGRGLVTMNAAGLSGGIFESDLFRHVKGAFTDAKTDPVGRFELAAGARSPRRHPSAGNSLSAAPCAALQKKPHRLRAGHAPGAARPSMAGQHPRARSCGRARRADGAGLDDPDR